MQTPRDGRLKVIRGAKLAVPGRPARRRLVSRPVNRATAIEDVLRRLDREPVEAPIEVEDREPVEDLPRDGGRVEDREPVDGLPRDGGRPGVVKPAAGPDTATGDGRRTGSPAGRALVGLLAVALAATLAAAVVYGHRWYADRAVEEARQGALAAAKQVAVNFVSVSAASVDRDLQRISAGAAGDFKEEFARGQSQVRAAVVENKVESQGSVLRAGMVSGDRRRAVVLVAVDATVKNVKAPEGRPSHYRIQMDLVHEPESGQWLVSRLQFVG
ncbi:hypothetical protein [Micromonospora sp. KC213]|uniref:hypothetical protein n=1 Tax=Micromonospora sp. KC213 TaxID=2530378 RepID=UPI00104C9A76|nr:hypothetical protein [Micromonospora sp. KC213]TDC43509.1 hypothetical protein E1166_03640 [Micromonospora sp. KC213]